MRRCINCDESDAAAYGRRPDLEARRLLGVEAQDARLLLRPPAAAGRARRALALLERAAAGAPGRRGPLRRVGLVAGHYLWSVLCLATFQQCGEQWFLLTGPNRYFLALSRALVSDACSLQTPRQWQASSRC